MTELEDLDSIRKNVRKLEGEIDVKLTGFGKLCHKFEGKGVSALTAETLRSKSAELEYLLKNLETQNEKLNSLSHDQLKPHLLSRHLEIFQEYNREFERFKEKILPNNVDSTSENVPLVSVQVQGSILRERAAIHNSSTSIDAIIDHATAIADEIKSQGSTFNRISGRLVDLGMQYPVVGSLLKTISRRKSRDKIILGVVVGTCLAFTIAYVLWK